MNHSPIPTWGKRPFLFSKVSRLTFGPMPASYSMDTGGTGCRVASDRLQSPHKPSWHARKKPLI